MSGASGVGAAAPALLEREHELGTLAAVVDATAAGAARLVVVEGPAGIGKTQLVAEGRRRAADAGLRVLSARGGELEREYAFGVVRQLFEPALVAPDAREQLLAGAAAPAATLFEVVDAEALGEADSSFAVLHGLYWLTINLSAERPLLLAIDDLHWCDRASLRFLAFLVRRLEGLPVLALASLRTAEPGVDAALIVELLGDPLTLQLHPRPLSEAAVADLVRSRLGDEADAPFAASCHAATGGNPLLLNELLKALETEGVPPVAENVTTVRELGPRAASRAVLVRLARLHADAVAVARAVAVLGDGPDLATVAALADVDLQTAATATGDLARAEIMRHEPPLGFVHPLVAGAVYRDIPPGERDLRHERAARLLEKSGGSAEQVAAHVLAISPRGEDWSVATLRRAAGQALHKGAPESAVAYLTRALAEPPPREHEPHLLLDLGIAEALTFGPAATEHLRLAHQRLEDPLLRATAAERLVRALLFTGDPAGSAEVARATAAELPAELADLRRTFEAAELATVLFRSADVDSIRVEPPDDQAEGLGARMLAAVVAIERCYSNRPAEECFPPALRALEGGELIAADNGGFFTMASIITLVVGEHPLAEAVWQEARADAHRRGSLFAIAAIHLWYGNTLLRRGELADARGELEAGAAAFEGWGYGLGAQFYVRSFLALTLLELGEAAEARRTFDRSGDPPDVAADVTRYWLLTRLALEVAEGRDENAVATAELIARDYPAVVNVALNPWRGIAAEAHDRLGDRERALALAAEELELARRWGAPGAIGRALRVLGTLEREDGLEHLREAVETLAASPARLEHAKALAALGAALRRSRRPSDARDPLRRALELADACGAAALAEDIRSELYATGARPRSTAASGVGSLTASEKRVVSLAAEGQTNRDIAQTLFITPKTVEVHLSNAYRKLGISSRRELAAALVA
jgi:DNA-binding CsgD family transcriptional regulator